MIIILVLNFNSVPAGTVCYACEMRVSEANSLTNSLAQAIDRLFTDIFLTSLSASIY